MLILIHILFPIKRKMEANNNVITVGATINAPIEKVWKYWTGPEHIVNWNQASPDWHTPKAENDLKVGGRFVSRMEARDGSMGFDFGGTYTDVTLHEAIAYVLDDDRKVNIAFTTDSDTTTATINFEAESVNSHELQQLGWQAIINSFKHYAETN